MLALWKKSYDKPRQHIKKQRHHIVNKGPQSQNCDFSSSHVLLLELDHKGWVLKNWCFWIVVVEKTFESPSDCKEIKPVDPKGNQLWIFIGRTDAEVPILWPLDAKSNSLKKTVRLGKIDGGRSRVTEDAMVGWHHQLNGHEFEQTPRESEGQGSQAYYNPWGRKQSDVA